MSDADNALIVRITEQVRAQLASTAAGSGPGICSAPCQTCPSFKGCTTTTSTMTAMGATRIGARPGTGPLPADLAGSIDHTLLKPETTRDEIVQLCKDARQYRFASVCVNPTWIRLCRSLLEGTDVMTCVVIGFPLGAMTPAAKAFEAREAVRAGAQELDMVLNIGALKSGDFDLVAEDIRRVVAAARPIGVKVILETSKLDEEEKVIGSALAKLAGAAFVKTSTGFGGGGATVDDIALMRKIVGPELGVKASGGVRSTGDAEAMIAAGATRIGASASIAIVTGKKSKSAGY